MAPRLVARPIINTPSTSSEHHPNHSSPPLPSSPSPKPPTAAAVKTSWRSHFYAASLIVAVLFLLALLLSSSVSSFLQEVELEITENKEKEKKSLAEQREQQRKAVLSQMKKKATTYWQRRKVDKYDLEALAKQAADADEHHQQHHHHHDDHQNDNYDNNARSHNNSSLHDGASNSLPTVENSVPQPHLLSTGDDDSRRHSHAFNSPLVKWSDAEMQQNNSRNLSNGNFLSSSPSKGMFDPACERVAGDAFLAETWRNSRRVACRVNNTIDNPAGWSQVSEFLLDHLDLKPSIRLYENVVLESFTGPFRPAGCENSHLVGEKGERITGLSWMGPATKYKTRIARNLSATAAPVIAQTVAVAITASENASSGAAAATAIMSTTTTTSLPLPPTTEAPDPQSPDEKSDDNFYRGKLPKAIDFVSANNDDIIGVRYVRFHLGNIFEGIHAYVNTYLLIQALQLDQRKLQFIFEDRQENVYRDDEFWESFTLNTLRPVYRYRGKDKTWRRRRRDDKLQPVFMRRVIQGPSTGISVIVSNAHPLKGRGHDHHCSSSLMQNSTVWMRRNFELLGRLPPKRVLSPRATNGKIEVVWCSRGVHPRAGGALLLPHRHVARETDFVLALREALGPDVKLRVVDFGRIDGAVESIRAVETAQVVIGCHGAGLTWSVFMKASDAAVIEIFGGNRAASNRHYHNIARLMDFHYQSMTLSSNYRDEKEWWPVEGEKRGMTWDHNHIRKIQQMVFGLPWDKSIKLRRPCSNGKPNSN